MTCRRTSSTVRTGGGKPTIERPYPTRVPVTFHGKRGHLALDQIRTVDRQRLVRKLGAIPAKTARSASTILVEMFTRQ